MSVLVTGAPGWLGTTLVERLADRGEDVRCLVYPGADVGDLDAFDVTVARGDVTDGGSVLAAFDDDVERVIHCAGVNHPAVRGGVSLIHEINAEGTRHVLEAARQHDVDHVVYVSSIVAHGFNEGPNDVITEETPMRPRTEYGRSKLQAERYVRAYRERHGLASTVLRPCWYYGPGQPERMATLMRSIASGRPIMFGDGRNRRSMTYVPALVDLMMRVLDQPDASKDEAFVAADRTVYTTNEIYETMARHIGVEANPVRLREPLPTLMKYVQRTLERFDVHFREAHVAWEMSRNIAADPSKAVEVLGWEPPASLDPGMETAVEWATANGQV